MPSEFIKDPQAVKRYQITFDKWLEPGETITAHTVTPDSGITVDSDTADDTSVTVTVSGGTLGQSYGITCHITTSSGQQEDATIRVIIRNR